MKAKQIDKLVDEGETDVMDLADLSSASRLNHETFRVNVDFPKWVVKSLDNEASRVGVTRQSLIKLWLVERIVVTCR
ncbi:MAG: CopG family transcriptional regulator [Thiotrichales bacterium]|jgi:hypothetical protein|nr:CopG family transcriptional regulator [Thiotrichales bacterium]MBT3614051.1 CopG family transcriptional regulator [Thiotrichales bacterium]MBT3753281.1 CopG family transcriptional regulator [Thiotrichales bacterium]MBT3836738.1 CopG family transcriptional regulator [Thiotrichales bacterium]MBT4151490.1 CopG family transcriptional regulator [Thiotrichales bacterium]